MKRKTDAQVKVMARVERHLKELSDALTEAEEPALALALKSVAQKSETIRRQEGVQRVFA